MRDREAINRFVAFSLIGWRNYTTGDMDGFLAKGLKLLADSTEKERLDIRRRFDAAMTLSYRLFQRRAFRKSLASDVAETGRGVINISLFEVSAVVFARFAETFDPQSDSALHETIVGLLRNDVFRKSITYSTNSTQAVHQRFGILEAAVEQQL